jgi:NAD(P)-dependent dehydrogenase (short-subunit alcohol dehydrogenase family)
MKALIFGASGAIGSYLYAKFKKDGMDVIGTTRNKENNEMIFVDCNDFTALQKIENVDIVIWGHGCNFNDNINDFNSIQFNLMIDANVGFILNTLNFLLRENKINNNAKLAIISSIWEENTRKNKLSYSISKSSLAGLVKNVAYDLSFKNILINNILPGVIDNEMSRKTILPEDFNYIQNYMGFNRLVDLDDVYNTVKFMVIDNTGITGQSIKLDLGFSNFRKYSE